MRKKIVGLFALMLSVAMITGCGGASDSSSSFATTDEYDGGGFDSAAGTFYADTSNELADSKMASVETAGESSLPEVPQAAEEVEEYDTSRKIVYTSNIDIETKNFDEDLQSIKKLVQDNGGYFENTSVSGQAEYGGRYASYTARIPSAKYQGFMENVGTIGSVTSSHENADDITSSYVDVQARLKSLKTKLARLQELEENAQTVEELLEIEDRINDVQYDLENYTAQLRLYDNQVDYCTVSISLNEVVTYTEIKADTFWNRFTEAIEGSLSGFVSFLQGLVIVVVYLLPYVVVIALIACMVLYILKRKGKVPTKLKEKKKVEKSATNSKPDSYAGPTYSDDDKKQ